MSSVLLTDIFIKRTQARDKHFEIWDAKVKGLTLRIFRKVKTFNCLYKFMGHNDRLKLGRYPSMTLKEARQKADEALRQVSRGIDPKAEKLRKRSSYTDNLFSRVVMEFIENHAKPQHPKLERVRPHSQERVHSEIRQISARSNFEANDPVGA